MGNEIDYKEKLIKTVIDEYEKGWTVPEIAERFSLKKPTIYRWLKDRDAYVRKPKGRKLSKHQQKVILEMFKHGFSAREISKLLRHKLSTVKDYIIKLYIFDEDVGFDIDEKDERDETEQE